MDEALRPREFRSAPSALAFMARAIVTPSRPGWKSEAPRIAAAWHGHRVGERTLAPFLACTGLHQSPDWPLLYPQAAGFRLQMALLTERSFPLPIWNSLQVRNRLQLHRPFDRGVVLDLRTQVAERRVLQKGAEIDLRTTAHAGGSLVWEGISTFYYRGRYGEPDLSAPVASAPLVEGSRIAEWRAPEHGRFLFGRLTGDYNGIHLADWYASRFGFRRAFLHPQRMLGQCLAHLPPPAARAPLGLEAWLKGPVFYGARVALRGSAGGFALHIEGDERPAIVGRLC